MGTMYLQPKGSSPALAIEIDQPAAEGAFWRPCQEGPALCVSALAPLLLSVLPIGWILLGQAQSVLETRVPVPFTQLSGGVCWLWYQIAGITKKLPFSTCQHRCCDCHCHPNSPPSALCLSWSPARGCTAPHALQGAFPGTLLSLGPKRCNSSGWGSWFREGLDWFGCFKIDFLVQWCLRGRRGIDPQCEVGWMGK